MGTLHPTPGAQAQSGPLCFLQEDTHSALHPTVLRHGWTIKDTLIHTSLYERISQASGDETSALPTWSCEPLRLPGYAKSVIQLKESA